MTKNKKISITICTLMLITLCYFMPTFIRSNYSVVRADSSVDFDDTKYTDSDQLLKKDGTFSDKSIQKFAKEVQDGKNDTYFPELAEVIPRKYLETSAGKATFAYNGKEYGFYVVKDRAEFNVLLIDFSYEFDDDDQIHTSDLEYVIRIKPILQQTFKRSRDSSGAYTYMKVENEDRYYVANPRFASVLRNENDLNYGDDGYDKLKDDGVMISQTRLNYSKIAYSTGNDLITNIENFTIKKLTSAPKDFAYDLLDSETYGVGGTILRFFDELDQDIVDAGKEETIVADNETNIKTGISREEQRNDPNIPSYLRIVGVMPEGEIVLSGTTNSYAEMITVVDNANSRTRLNQLCEFDIFYRSGDYSTMKTVASDYGFSKERILFDNKSVTPLEDEVSQDDYAYMITHIY